MQERRSLIERSGTTNVAILSSVLSAPPFVVFAALDGAGRRKDMVGLVLRKRKERKTKVRSVFQKVFFLFFSFYFILGFKISN